MPYPTLLPKSTANRALKPMIVVCGTTFVASVACYFLVAIIPWENLPYGEYAFTFGSIGGATLLCIIGVICGLTNDRLNIYRTFPWLIIVAIASFALFLMGERFFVPSFFVVLAAVSIFEVLLVMYFGVLGVKGTFPSASHSASAERSSAWASQSATPSRFTTRRTPRSPRWQPSLHR